MDVLLYRCDIYRFKEVGKKFRYMYCLMYNFFYFGIKKEFDYFFKVYLYKIIYIKFQNCCVKQQKLLKFLQLDVFYYILIIRRNWFFDCFF